MASMPSARRLLRAGLLTLCAWLLLGTAIGVVSADDGKAESFVMPQVMLGDRAQYERSTTDDEDEMLGTFTVAWAERDPLVLRDGAWHDLDALQTEFHVDRQDGDISTTGTAAIEFAYEAGTDDLAVLGITGDVTQEFGSDVVLPALQQQSENDIGIQMLLYVARPFPQPDCLFGGIWGGQEVRADGALQVPELCMPLVGMAAGMTLQGKGVEEIDGVQAAHFHGKQTVGGGLGFLAGASEPGPLYRAELDIWLAPAASMPLRIEARTEAGGAWENETMVMTAFERGSQPRGGPLLPPAGLAPSLQYAPMEGLVPFRDSDSGHPFTLSRAIQAARIDPGVADFLAEHPDAFAVQAHFQEQQRVGEPQRRWSFTLADESESMAVVVAQAQPSLAAGLPPALADALQAHQVIVGEVERGGGLARRDVPGQLPTIGSLFALWAWQNPDQAPPQAWDYDLRGPNTLSLFDPEPGLAIRVGRDLQEFRPGEPTPAGAAVESGWAFDLTSFEMDGAPTGRMVLQADGSTMVGPSTPALGADAGSAPLAAAQAPEGWLPTPAQAAGAGLVALLLGALYWLWPKLKVLAFAGLFSRLAPSQLLDHPGRARLVEIIRAEPGIHFQELVRRSGLASGTAVHHLNKLARGNLVAARPLGRYTCYFPGSSPDRASLAAAPLLRSGGARLVYEAIQGSPHLSGLELAERTGLQKSTVNYHVQRLTEAGLVTAKRDGRAVRLRAVGPVAAAANT